MMKYKQITKICVIIINRYREHGWLLDYKRDDITFGSIRLFNIYWSQLRVDNSFHLLRESNYHLVTYNNLVCLVYKTCHIRANQTYITLSSLKILYRLETWNKLEYFIYNLWFHFVFKFCTKFEFNYVRVCFYC